MFDLPNIPTSQARCARACRTASLRSGRLSCPPARERHRRPRRHRAFLPESGRDAEADILRHCAAGTQRKDESRLVTLRAKFEQKPRASRLDDSIVSPATA
jgi:hypothetical protein